jgi:hypothetical protein
MAAQRESFTVVLASTIFFTIAHSFPPFIYSLKGIMGHRCTALRSLLLMSVFNEIIEQLVAYSNVGADILPAPGIEELGNIKTIVGLVSRPNR